MQGWLIYSKEDAEENKSYIDWFIHEGKQQHVHIKLIYREKLHLGIHNAGNMISYDNKQITLPDFVVVRTIEPMIQHIFESLAIPTFNPFYVAHTANHKGWTYTEINKLGIPILPTYFTTKKAFPTHPPLPFPFVVKEATGRGGKEVHYITCSEQWNAVKHHLHSNDIVIQDANVKLGKDVRVFVIGEQIIAAVLRKNDDDFRANFKLGGIAQVFTLSDKQINMIRKIINHFNFGLVGIDFFIDHQGELIFNEIEDVVGSRILSATTNINLLEKYITFIKKSVLKKDVSEFSS